MHPEHEKSPSIRIRLHTPGDIEALAEHANNAEVALYMGPRFPHPYGRQDAEEFLEVIKRNHAEGRGIHRVIALEGSDELIGGVGISGIDAEAKHGVMGYWLGRKFWGKGLATEAAQNIVKIAFDEQGLERLTSKVYEPNQASARVLEKIGFVLEGTMRQAVVVDGVRYDELVYGLLASETSR